MSKEICPCMLPASLFIIGKCYVCCLSSCGIQVDTVTSTSAILQMKMFSRLRSKLLCAKDNMVKPEPDYTCQNAMHKRCDEELSSYPNPLLAIGTFGGNLKDSCKGHLQNTTNSEEPGEGNKVLDRLLPNHHTTIDLTSSLKSEKQRSSSMKKSLDTLPEEEKIANNFLTENKAVHLRRTTSGKNGMYKQSFSFLLERQLLYRNGFLPSPVLEDSLPDPEVDKSRMKKILKAMLGKKKYHRRQKYLDTVETQEGEANWGYWVKTDSEYIVLEL